MFFILDNHHVLQLPILIPVLSALFIPISFLGTLHLPARSLLVRLWLRLGCVGPVWVHSQVERTYCTWILILSFLEIGGSGFEMSIIQFLVLPILGCIRGQTRHRARLPESSFVLGFAKCLVLMLHLAGFEKCGWVWRSVWGFRLVYPYILLLNDFKAVEGYFKSGNSLVKQIQKETNQSRWQYTTQSLYLDPLNIAAIP